MLYPVYWLVAGLILGGPGLSPSADKLAKAIMAYRSADFGTCASYAHGQEKSGLLNQDVALFIQGQCRFYSGDYSRARKCFNRLVKRFPASPHAVLARYRAADCAVELRKPSLAAIEYERAAARQPDSRIDPAVGLYHRASWALARQKNKQGRTLWKQLLLKHPDHPLADDFPAGLAEPKLSFEESLALAESLHSARKWERALAVLDEVLEPATRRQRFALAYRAGRILFDMRNRYEQAAELLLAARKHAPGPREAQDSWFYYSRALGRLDQDDQAIASHLAMVRRYPKGIHSSRALFYAGWLEQNQDRCDRAILHLANVLKRYPEARWAQDARWTKAWCHIRHKQWDETIATLTPQHRHANPEIGGRALYWTGLARASRGQARLARKLWKRTIRRFPLTWYSLLARLRLGVDAPAWPKPPAAKAHRSLPGKLTARTEELTRVGLHEFGSLLLRHEEEDFLTSREKNQGLVTLMNAYRQARDFHRPWKLTFRHRLGTLRRLPTAETREIWDHSYSACSRDLLSKYAGKDPELVLFLQAIMRTESGFDPMALSVANARGLLQLYPPTAGRVARLMDIAYSEDELFDPEYNIRMGAWFIGRLVKKFKRQWPLAAAAYNGGAPAMTKWCREDGKLLLDAFVESIPWSESRRYAKRVTAALARYAYLEGAPPPELRLVVEPDYLDDELDF